MLQADTINMEDLLHHYPSSYASSQKQEDDPSYDSQRSKNSNEKKNQVRHQTVEGEIHWQESQAVKEQEGKQKESNAVKKQENHQQVGFTVKQQEGYWQEYNAVEGQEGHQQGCNPSQKQEGHWQVYNIVKQQEGYWQEYNPLYKQGHWLEYNAVKGQEGQWNDGYTVYKKKSRKGKKIKNDHPIKNFLQDFRKPFLDCIRKGLKDDKIFNEFQIITRIKTKKCINLSDYQDLFNEKQFRPILKQYFKQKEIIRDLMKSRVKYHRKREYFHRINVFEDAFKRREFKKIYY